MFTPSQNPDVILNYSDRILFIPFLIILTHTYNDLPLHVLTCVKVSFIHDYAAHTTFSRTIHSNLDGSSTKEV